MPIQQQSVFKTATIVYNFLKSGDPKYFKCFLNPRKSFVYNTSSSQMNGEVLKVPQFISSVHKSTKQFLSSFAYDAPKLLNELPDDICPAHISFFFSKQSES